MAEHRTPHEKAIPNYENAVIPREKLERYSLDSAHEPNALGTTFDEPSEAYDLELANESGDFIGFAYSIKPDQFTNLSRAARS